MKYRTITLCVFFLLIFGVAAADDSATNLAEEAVLAAGGAEKISVRFRLRDNLSVGKDPDKAKIERLTYVEAPAYWRIKKMGKWVERTDEPAKWLVWGWTLGPLVDSDSIITSIAGVEEGGKTSLALQVTDSVEPAMDLHFDPDTKALVRIDWDDEIARFSEWTDFGGYRLPATCDGFRRKSNAPWYFCDILEVEVVEEIPAEVRGE